MSAILFVCTANQIRSPIAAKTFNDLVQRDGPGKQLWRADSAGTWTKTGLPEIPHAIKLAERLGVDISSHLTTSIEDVDFEKYTWVLVMERGHLEALTNEYAVHKDKIQLLSSFAGAISLDIPDPVSADLKTALGWLEEMQAMVVKLSMILSK